METGSEEKQRPMAFDTASYDVKVLAGSTQGFLDGVGSKSMFDDPRGLAFDKQGNLVVADRSNSCIRLVTMNGVVSTVAGAKGQSQNLDGPLHKARFSWPVAVAVDRTGDGSIYVCDSAHTQLRRIADGKVESVQFKDFDGKDINQKGAMLYGVAVDSFDGALYTVDHNKNCIMRRLRSGECCVLSGFDQVQGRKDGPIESARFLMPTDCSVDASSGIVHVCEYSHCVRLVLGRGAFVHQLAALDFLGFSHPLINLVAEYVGGFVSTLAGYMPPATLARPVGDWDRQLLQPKRSAFDKDGNCYVTDAGHRRIVKIERESGRLVVIAGALEEHSPSPFQYPYGIAVDERTGDVYVSDSQLHLIFRVSKRTVA